MKEPEQTQEAHPDNSILIAIAKLRKGRVVQSLSEAMGEVLDAVEITGKPGKLVLTLEVSPSSKGAQGEVLIKDDITTKLPRIDKGSSFFFVSNGRLSKEDPSGQTDMFRSEEGDATDNHEQEAQQANG